MGGNESYEHYVDLVCEGGGVKGIGLAGAYSVLEEHDFEPQNVAGTSAGAITAALIAARYTADELKEIILTLDYRQFEDKGWEDRLPLIGRSASILLDQGLYEGKRFYEWMRELLAAKGIHTFADLVNEQWADDPMYRSRLQVIASDVTGRRLLVLPRDAALLGLKPDERKSVAERLPEPEPHQHGVGPLIEYIKGMAQTMMEAHDRLYVEKAEYARTIAIPTLGVGTTEFGITRERALALYESGRDAAEKFLERS